MNLTNIIPLSYVTQSLTPTSTGASDTSSSGVIGNIYDGNNGTNFLWYVHHNGDGTVEGYLDFQVTWVKPKTIRNVSANGTAQMDGGNYFIAVGGKQLHLQAQSIMEKQETEHSLITGFQILMVLGKM